MKLDLLGHPTVQLQNEKRAVPLSRPFLLLVYLACLSEWVRRDDLAFFLRPDIDRETAQQYLRKLVSNARKFPWLSGLEVEAERLRWQVDTDIQRFRRAQRDKSWHEAAALYRGPLVSGVDIPFWPSFDAWLQIEREALANDWQEVMLHQAEAFERLGKHREAAAAAAKVMDHDPFNEGALQNYLRNTYFMGQREQALRAAHKFEARLSDELDYGLLPATQQLVEVIRSAEPLEKHPSPARYGRRRNDLVDHSLNDRSDELMVLLGSSGSRLVSMSPAGDGETVVIIAKRVSDTRALLAAIIRLAADLMYKRHRARALELLFLVLNHPGCDSALRKEIEKVWPDLERLTALSLPE